mmetsp:Transcript_128590/g.372103  ORF Transcript_128590/g.372103 Transcript_128590/m.372103 type:complete len:201 (+) Transcript_128590:1068-1670(+)
MHLGHAGERGLLLGALRRPLLRLPAYGMDGAEAARLCGLDDVHRPGMFSPHQAGCLLQLHVPEARDTHAAAHPLFPRAGALHRALLVAKLLLAPESVVARGVARARAGRPFRPRLHRSRALSSQVPHGVQAEEEPALLAGALVPRHGPWRDQLRPRRRGRVHAHRLGDAPLGGGLSADGRPRPASSAHAHWLRGARRCGF